MRLASVGCGEEPLSSRARGMDGNSISRRVSASPIVAIARGPIRWSSRLDGSWSTLLANFLAFRCAGASELQGWLPPRAAREGCVRRLETGPVPAPSARLLSRRRMTLIYRYFCEIYDASRGALPPLTVYTI